MLNILREELTTAMALTGSNNNNDNDKHDYAGAADGFTHVRILLVLTDRGIWPSLSSLFDGRGCPSLG
jgi:hypothetical protein